MNRLHGTTHLASLTRSDRLLPAALHGTPPEAVVCLSSDLRLPVVKRSSGDRPALRRFKLMAGRTGSSRASYAYDGVH